MGFFGSFTGASQRKDQKSAYTDSNATLDRGYGAAQGNLTGGYGAANDAYSGGRADINSGYGAATGALSGGVDKAVGQYQPYAESGARANTQYSNALGINGRAAQENYARDYQSSDPFRASNETFANNALMQQYNARGLSGSGVAAAAVAQESLRRGSADYENHLNRIQGVQGQGFQAAGATAGIYANQGQQQAQYGFNQGTDLANIQGQRAQTASQYGQGQAGLNTDLATGKAGNRINLGNSLANSRSIFTNNLMGLAGMGLKASGVRGYGKV